MRLGPGRVGFKRDWAGSVSFKLDNNERGNGPGSGKGLDPRVCPFLFVLLLLFSYVINSMILISLIKVLIKC